MRNDLVDNIRLNMNAEQVRACVYVRAGDTRARTLHFTIVKDGQVVDMTDLVIAELIILKPDGHECDQSMTRYGNELHYTLRTQDINVPGDNRAQVHMTFSDGTVYESPEFSIMVYDKLDPRYETSTNEYTALNAKLALADETVEEAQEALDAAEALLDDAEDLRDEMVQLKDDTEGFKNDASQSASDASGYASDASGYATSASGSATLSESWAVGGTNTRAGEDTNNSKYWSQQAANSASSASGSATAAAGSATSAESWAVGGTGTRTGEDTNNAKYWSDTASGAASDALLYKNDAYNSEQDAAGHASDALAYMNYASGSATEAESWAVGGTGTRAGEDTNNAKYWATQATVNDGTLTITQNGTPLGTFTANASSNVTIDVPSAGSPSASSVSYDNTVSGLTATDVQDAIDEVVADIPTDFVSKASGGTFNGNLGVNRKNGTSSTLGESLFTLGNNIPSGSEGNSTGKLRVYGNNEYRTDITAPDSTAHRTIQLPNASGTVALTTTDNKFSDGQTIDEQDGTTAIVGSSLLSLGNNTAEGVAKNSKGIIKIFGKGIYRAHLMATNITGNRDIELPDANGTLALKSDLPSDSGWVQLSAVDGNIMMYRKIGKVVYVARHTVGTIAANTAVRVGTLPSGYRPFVAFFSGATTQYIQINTDGKIYVKTATANYMEAWYVSFIADA